MISVVIPVYSTRKTSEQVGEEVWYTVASVVSDLERTGAPYEIALILNGEYPMNAALMHEADMVKPVFCGPHINSPQAARNVGAEQTSGETIFFLDSHVIVPPGFFKQMQDDLDETGAAFMGTGHRWLGSKKFYGCRIAWEEYLWSRETMNVPPLGEGKLWKTAIHPHGAFAVRRKAYDDIGGYWQALRGFGGEESQLCLKMWMMGYECWATPRTYHWHWLPPGGRRTSDLFRDENFARNFLLVAAAYGDAARVKQSHDSMEMLHWGNIDIFPMMQQQVLNSPEVETERSLIAERAKYKSLAELRTMFDRNDVLH